MRILSISETSSTNDYLHTLLQQEDMEEGSVVVAQHQHKGKGQRGNSWESEKGKNLLFSLLLRPQKFLLPSQFLLSQTVAVGIVDALSKYEEGLSIKWPNDIYWRDRKLGGILIENSLLGEQWEWSIVGIGINVLQESFSQDVPNPISLIQIHRQEYSLETLLNEILKGIGERYQEILSGKYQGVQKEYLKRLYLKDKVGRYRDKDGEFEGIIRGVSPLGRLELETISREVRSYTFKEVLFIQQ